MLAASLVLFFLLGGCAMVGPDFVTPDAPVADAWLMADNPWLSGGDADYSSWWKAFNDPVLDRIIAQTYAHNLTLQVAGLRILQARAQLGIATGSLYPQQQRAFGEAAANQLSDNTGLPVPDRNYESLDAGFDASWELDIWGKYRRSVESGMAVLDASIAGYDDILVTVTAEAARAYIQIRTLEERIKIAGENVTIQKKSLEIAEAQFEGGEVSKLDVTQARSLLSNTQASIPRLASSLHQIKNALAILLGMLPGDLESMLQSPGRIPAASGALVVELPAELLRRRPDIRLAELRVAAQSPQIGAAKADLYPHFTLFGTIGWQSTNADYPLGESSISDTFSSKSLFWKAGPGITWDFLNYGRIKNRVRSEDAALQQTIVQYRDTVLNAHREVEDAAVAFVRAKEEAQFLQVGVDSARESVDLSLLQYQEGNVDFQRVLDTQRFLSSQADQLSEIRGRVSTNLVALYKAIGGGWQIRVGHAFVDADTRERMGKRTDWGGLLTPEASTPPGATGAADNNGAWRRADW